MAREPYLVTVIRQLADLEAMAALTPDDTMRLNGCRTWLGEHYPAVSEALAREYIAMHATPSDEDRIRDAMAEAAGHPGRVITR